jgi:hypothetical protein
MPPCGREPTSVRKFRAAPRASYVPLDPDQLPARFRAGRSRSGWRKTQNETLVFGPLVHNGFVWRLARTRTGSLGLGLGVEVEGPRTGGGGAFKKKYAGGFNVSRAPSWAPHPGHVFLKKRNQQVYSH